MAVYVDDARNPLGRMIMCHMLADTLDELFEMAERIGMRREWYQPTSFPHFDLATGRRKKAVGFGAIEVDRRRIVTIRRQLRTDPSFLESMARHHAQFMIPVPFGGRWSS